MPEQLKPCPFCGKEVVLVEHHLLNHPYISHKILFSLQNPPRVCFIESLTMVGENPINDWNRRYQEPKNDKEN